VPVVRRHIVGSLAAVLLAGALVLQFLPQHEHLEPIWASCWRLGALLAVWWLAWPDLQRLPGWLLAVFPLLAIILWRVPKLFLLAVPALIVVALLRPRRARRS
jgi:hypothetical protein